MYRKFFLKKPSNGERGDFLWTVASGVIYSLTSLVFLIVVSNVLGDVESNIYSIGMMVAQQMLTVGRFSVRNFQVSDVKDKYSFGEYLSFRIITCTAAILITAGWIIIGGYTGEVAVVIAAFTIHRISESFSDLFEGLYQQKLRLDISGKSQFVKNVIMLITFCGLILLTRNLVFSSVFLAAESVILLFIIDFPLIGNFAKFKVCFRFKAMWQIGAACFSLFLSSFLHAYINNSPKYAIENYHGEGSEIGVGRFSMLFMPTFAVELLAGFTLRTWLTKMAISHEEGDSRTFRKLILQQLGVITVVTGAAMVLMYFLGGFLLSFIYGTDLYGYETVNALLMFCGGLVAVYSLFENVVIIYRKQHFSIIINIVSTVAAAVIVPALTEWGFILGATIGFVIANAIRVMGYGILSLCCAISENKPVRNK
ncbi:MAG: lipopolysaccharide biosynthesis protein [Butyrivibrio sp.]